MATITNVTLNLQRTGPRAPGAARTASVTFNTRFSDLEVQNRVLFTAQVDLHPVDDTEYPQSAMRIEMASVRADQRNVETTVSQTFMRSTLDEDADTITFEDQNGHQHQISMEAEDEWRARVTLTPVVQTISRNSAIVRGSWGREGNN